VLHNCCCLQEGTKATKNEGMRSDKRNKRRRTSRVVPITSSTNYTSSTTRSSSPSRKKHKRNEWKYYHCSKQLYSVEYQNPFFRESQATRENCGLGQLIDSSKFCVKHDLPRGWRVCATAMFKKQDLIVNYAGILRWGKKMKEEVEDIGRFHVMHTRQLRDGRVIDARFIGNSARFLRCSCSPNAVLKEVQLGPCPEWGVFATEVIRKGKEITIPYDLPFNVNTHPHECGCGKKTCSRHYKSKELYPYHCKPNPESFLVKDFLCALAENDNYFVCKLLRTTRQERGNRNTNTENEGTSGLSLLFGPDSVPQPNKSAMPYRNANTENEGTSGLSLLLGSDSRTPFPYNKCSTPNKQVSTFTPPRTSLTSHTHGHNRGDVDSPFSSHPMISPLSLSPPFASSVRTKIEKEPENTAVRRSVSSSVFLDAMFPSPESLSEKEQIKKIKKWKKTSKQILSRNMDDWRQLFTQQTKLNEAMQSCGLSFDFFWTDAIPPKYLTKITCFTQLKHLSIINTKYHNRAFKFLQKLTHLESLELNNCCNINTEIKLYFPFLSNLINLEIVNCRSVAISVLLTEIIQKLPKLTSFNFSSSEVDQKTCELLSEKHWTVKRLVVNDCTSLVDEVFKTVVKNNTLHFLELNNCASLHDHTWNAISNSQAASLSHLSVQNTTITVKCVARLSFLKYLDIRGSQLDKEEVVCELIDILLNLKVLKTTLELFALQNYCNAHNPSVLVSN